MTKTKTTVLVSVTALVLIALAVAVKMIFFPSVSDKFFQTNPARLRQAPPGLGRCPPDAFCQYREKVVPAKSDSAMPMSRARNGWSAST